MRGNVDRISEGYIVIRMEDNSIKNLIFDKYPFIKVGDVVIIDEEKIIVDEEATKKLKEKIDDVNAQIEKAERNYDLNKAAELKYATLPNLKKVLEQEEKEMIEKQKEILQKAGFII